MLGAAHRHLGWADKAAASTFAPAAPGMPRKSLLDEANKAGLGSTTVKHEGGAVIDIRGLPRSKGTKTSTSGMIEAIDLHRGGPPTQAGSSVESGRRRGDPPPRPHSTGALRHPGRAQRRCARAGHVADLSQRRRGQFRPAGGYEPCRALRHAREAPPLERRRETLGGQIPSDELERLLDLFERRVAALFTHDVDAVLTIEGDVPLASTVATCRKMSSLGKGIR